MSKIFNSKGSTFVTTLVATAILMIIAVSILTRIESSHKASNFNSAKINELVGITNLKMHMANLATCQRNLKDKSLSSTGELPLPNILDGSGNVLFAPGQTVAEGSLFISDIKLKNPAGDPSSVTSTTPAPAKGFALPTRIEISFRKEKLSFGSKTYTATLDIPVLVDSSAKILDCDASSSAFDLSILCQQLGGTLDAATNVCNYPTDCTQKDPTKLASGKCFNDGIASLRTALEEAKTALATPTPVPTATKTPETPTPEQQKAWAAAEEDLTNCIENGATVETGKITCTVKNKLSELTPNSGNVGSTVYSDPKVAGYIYKRAMDMVLAKFGYK